MVKRYQRSNQKSTIEEGETTQWPEETGQVVKQWYTKHYTKSNPTSTGIKINKMIKKKILHFGEGQIKQWPEEKDKP
jgi:hypothetical protein